MGEKVVSESVGFMKKVMKIRHDSITDLQDQSEIVREQLLQKLKGK